jgi:tetratricopeptide (TPR) repeat protein
MQLGVILIALLALTGAQGPAECTGLDCAPRGAAPAVTPDPAMQQVWQAAGELHQLKLRFVAALQRVTRAQAGTIGDEADELSAGIAAMRAALTEWDARVAQFDGATARLAPSAELHVARGTVFLDRHRPADALGELLEASRLDPERADVPALQALAYAASGRPAEALRAQGRAASRDAGNALLAYGVAQRAAAAKQPDAAAAALARVVDLLARVSDGTDVGAGNRAPFERVALLRQAGGVAPVFAQAAYATAYAHLEAGDFTAAMTAFEQAQRNDPMIRSAPAVGDAVRRAGQLLRASDVAGAVKRLEAGVQDAPSYAEAHRALAVALFVQGAYERAIQHASDAVRLEPVNERARLLLVEILAAAGRMVEARQALEGAKQALPASGTVRFRLGQLFRAEGRVPEALTEWRASARLAPIVGRDHLYFSIGSATVDQADFDSAVDAYTARLDVNPNNPEAHRQLGELFFLMGRDVAALAEHSVAAWLAPSDARAHAGRGHAFLRLGQHQAAVRAFARSVALDGDEAEVRFGYGTALLRSGKSDEARRQLELSQEIRAAAIARGQREFERAALAGDANDGPGRPEMLGVRERLNRLIGETPAR